MRYITLHAGTGETAIWCSLEDASRAVLQFDNHRYEMNAVHGAWIITRWKRGDSSDNKTTHITNEKRRVAALYDIAQGLDNHAIMSEKVARHEGYLTD